MYAYIDICSDRCSDYWVLDDIEDYCLVKVKDPSEDYSENISQKYSNKKSKYHKKNTKKNINNYEFTKKDFQKLNNYINKEYSKIKDIKNIIVGVNKRKKIYKKKN